MKTKTIKVNEDIIKMKCRPVSRCGNLCGYRTNINGKEYFKSVLTYQEAFDLSFVSFMKDKNNGLRVA